MLLFGFAKFLPNCKVENNAFVFNSKTNSVNPESILFVGVYCFWGTKAEDN